MKLNKPNYEERVVAFVDILGFKALVDEIRTQPDLHGRLHFALTHIKSYRDSALERNTAQSNLQVSVFSDSIAISAEPLNAFSVLWACGWLQATLLYSGILTRGGVARGATFHEGDLLYGDGLLAAHRIESSAAVYPRIVVVPTVVDGLTSKMRKFFLDTDHDGLWFIDPFRFDAMAGGASGLAADGYDPREIYFEEVGKHIAAAKKKVMHLDHLSKWTWLDTRYQAAAKNYTESGNANLAIWLREREKVPD